MFCGSHFIKLLDEAAGVPIMIAVFLPSGHVALQEFTDASLTLDLNVSIPVLEEPQSSLKQPVVLSSSELSCDGGACDLEPALLGEDACKTAKAIDQTDVVVEDILSSALQQA